VRLGAFSLPYWNSGCVDARAHAADDTTNNELRQTECCGLKDGADRDKGAANEYRPSPAEQVSEFDDGNCRSKAAEIIRRNGNAWNKLAMQNVGPGQSSPWMEDW
jgi:hypothetical protein